MTDQTPLPPDSPPAPPADVTPADAPPAAQGDPVLLKGEIEIYPDRRLAHLDQGPSKAYAARGRNGEAAVAYVCIKHLVPRISAAAKYNGITNPYMPKLLGSGVVDWNIDRQQKYVFVYENKLGRAVQMPGTANAMGWKADAVLSTVLKNIVPALRDMRDSDFVHGNIRATNIFDGGSTNNDRIMLGECLSLPPSYMQPPIYMTIERALADPIARGESTYDDDMFAFGVALGIMMRQHDPLEGMTEQEMLEFRIENSSFTAITGKDRFNGTILELLRGLLHDDVRLRWSIDDVMSWMEGNRINPKQTALPKAKASRPIEFSGKKYIKPAMLAADLHTNPAHCVQIVENSEMRQWINRSLQDQVLEKRFEDAVLKSADASAGVAADKMASFVAMALAPTYPIMYRGLKFMPDGFGRSMIDAFAMRKDLNIYTDVINQQVVLTWVDNVDAATAVDVGQIIGKYDSCKGFLRQNMIGYGIERCMYFMVPEAPCYSERLKDYYVRSAEELIEAYEHMSTRPGRPEYFFDRHIVSFLSVRDRGVIDPYLPDLASEDRNRKVLGVLRTLATIQKRGRMVVMPGLSAWLSDFIEPVFQRFHDRELRVELKSKLVKLRDKGDLVKIATLVDNPTMVAEDYKLYLQAIRDYAALRKEFNETEYALENDKNYGHAAGRQFSCLVSGVIAVIIIFATVFVKFGGLPFG